jgi:hypothetical protein
MRSSELSEGIPIKVSSVSVSVMVSPVSVSVRVLAQRQARGDRGRGRGRKRLFAFHIGTLCTPCTPCTRRTRAFSCCILLTCRRPYTPVGMRGDRCARERLRAGGDGGK